MLSVLDPLAAYREDLATCGRETLTENDGPIIELALLIERLAALPIDDFEQRARLETFARERLDEIGLPIERPHYEPPEVDPESLFARIRLVAQWLGFQSSGRLATSLVRAAERAFPDNEQEIARGLVTRARVARYTGSLDVIEDLMRRVEQIGRRTGSRELRTRRCVIMVGLYLERGNYPAMERWARRALAICGNDFSYSAGVAYQGLMVRESVRGNFNVALGHAWHAFQRFSGNQESEAAMLVNISKLLMDSGRPAPAVRGFIAAIRRIPKPADTLVAWGGLAGAAAGIGDVALVELATSRIGALADEMPSPFAVACALVNLARARLSIGLSGEPWAARAAELATQRGYHEISLEVEALHENSDAPRPIGRAPRRVEAGDQEELGQMIDAIESMVQIDDAYSMS